MFMMRIYSLPLAHVFGSRYLYTAVDMGDLNGLKIAWCSLRKVYLILDYNSDMSQKDINS